MIPSMPSESWSSAPTVSPGPMTMLNTPGGRPASAKTWVRLTPESGASDDGL